MTINLETGRRSSKLTQMVEGIMSRNDKMTWAALEVGDDAVALPRVNGTWISEDCEPVALGFDWQRYPPKETVLESDCICPKELAARLTQVFRSGDNEIPKQPFSGLDPLPRWKYLVTQPFKL